MRKENRNEDAVSPVIGVMLLLVVTVVIAAVVVGFSTGLAGSTGTTPTALFEVADVKTTEGGGELAYLNIRHKGGDVIPLSELQISLQSVGGSNSGIINMLLATDTESRKDMTVGEYVVDPVEQKNYDKWIADVKNIESEIEKLKKSVTNPTPDHPQYGTAILGEYPLDAYPSKEGWPPRGTSGSPERELYNQWKNVRDTWLIIQEKYVNLETAQAGLKQNGWTEEKGPTPKIIVGGDEYPVSVLGQDKPTESIVSTGDIIHIVAFDGYENSKIYAGTGVKWTISYIPTNSVIAKGEFEVIAD